SWGWRPQFHWRCWKPESCRELAEPGAAGDRAELAAAGPVDLFSERAAGASTQRAQPRWSGHQGQSGDIAAVGRLAWPALRAALLDRPRHRLRPDRRPAGHAVRDIV